MNTYPSFTTERVYFESEWLANRVWETINGLHTKTVVGFGFDGSHAAEPFWLDIMTTYIADTWTQEQWERWKACGRADL